MNELLRYERRSVFPSGAGGAVLGVGDTDAAGGGEGGGHPAERVLQRPAGPRRHGREDPQPGPA